MHNNIDTNKFARQDMLSKTEELSDTDKGANVSIYSFQT